MHFILNMVFHCFKSPTDKMQMSNKHQVDNNFKATAIAILIIRKFLHVYELTLTGVEEAL